jgi:anthranilate phosphoribosyltransferase
VSWEDLRGGEPAENAQVILRVLEGGKGPARAATVLNAAGAIYVAEDAISLAEAVARASFSIDTGKAREALERLRAASTA